MPCLIDQMSMSVDIGGDLGLPRRRQQLVSTTASQLLEQRPADRCQGVLVGLTLLRDYLKHGRTFPSRRSNNGPDHSSDVIQILLGKVRPLTSPGRRPSTNSDHCSTIEVAGSY